MLGRYSGNADPTLNAFPLIPSASLAPALLPVLLVLAAARWLTHRPEALRPLAARRLAVALLLFLVLRYLVWRVGFSLNTSSALALTLSLVLLGCEAFLLGTGMMQILLSWRAIPPRERQADRLEACFRAGAWQPPVDVLIPTCGEPLAVLRRCLVGVTAMRYPHKRVFVLDDSGRAEVEELANRLGCTYLSRLDRRGAKAGNLNFGLSHSHAELVAVFDADFIPQSHFLERTLGFFLEADVALVQTPQTFINADPLMRNLAMERWLLPDEESFYRWIQPVRDGNAAVVCAGTSFVVRRSALAAIGGFNPGALSEDFVAGLELTARGHRLVYLPEKLSAGLAAETMADFVQQRLRWCTGTLQTLRLNANPLRLRGLSAQQRFSYSEGLLHWFNNLPRLILLLMPLCVGLLGILPIRMTLEQFLVYALPVLCSQLALVGWLTRGSRHALLPELMSWLLAVPLAITVLRSLVMPGGGFTITPKHRLRQHGGGAWSLMLPLLVLLVVNLANLGAVLLQLQAAPLAPTTHWVGLFWGGLNTFALLVALRCCIDPPCLDPTPWLALHLPVQLRAEGITCTLQLEAISERGLEGRLTADLPPFSEATLQLPGLPAPLPASCLAKRERNVALAWEALSWDSHNALIQFLYCTPGSWPQRQAPSEWKALAVLFSQLLRAPREARPFRRSLVPKSINTTQSLAPLTSHP